MAMFHPGPHTGRRTSTPVAFCVTSYNVLSSHLAQPDHFRACDPADLEANTRLKRVKQQLNPEIEKGSVICLQEVKLFYIELLSLYAKQDGCESGAFRDTV